MNLRISALLAIVACVAATLATAPLAANSPANTSAYTFTQIDVPGATTTLARDINNAGQVVGYFFVGVSTQHGFVDTGGSFTQIDVPPVRMPSASTIWGRLSEILATAQAGTASSIPAGASLKLTCPAPPIRPPSASTTLGRSSGLFSTARVWLTAFSTRAETSPKSTCSAPPVRTPTASTMRGRLWGDFFPHRAPLRTAFSLRRFRQSRSRALWRCSASE